MALRSHRTFFLWRRIKDQVYPTKPKTSAQLKVEFDRACNENPHEVRFHCLVLSATWESKWASI